MANFYDQFMTTSPDGVSNSVSPRRVPKPEPQDNTQSKHLAFSSVGPPCVSWDAPGISFR